MGSELERTAVTAEDASQRPSLASWRVLRHHLRTTARTGTMPAGAALVSRIVAAAEELDHHPDLDLRYAQLHISVTTHSRGTLTEADVALAERITQIADEAGVTLEPGEGSEIEIALAARAPKEIRPFWRAVLGYREADGELADPHGRLPQLWFERVGDDGPDVRDVALDVHVPHDRAEARVEAAVAAGGRVVDDAHAPGRWVLADPEGAEVRLCTWHDNHGD